MGGAGMVVSRQQLKDIFGLKRLTEATDVISIVRAVFFQTHQVFLFNDLHIKKKKKKTTW